MSEYQYYEFQAIDRPLTEEEQDEICQLSSRVEPTSTQATFVYHYSSFRHDPKKVLANYFDIMLYMANWGSKRMMFRFPQSLVDLDQLEQY